MSRYYRTLVVDGTPSKLAERFYEGKVLTESHDRETFSGWRVRPTPKIRNTVSQLLLFNPPTNSPNVSSYAYPYRRK
jgi:hypothetical protein